MNESLEDTNRLSYRPLKSSDLTSLETILTDSETMEFSLVAPLSVQQVRDRLQQIIQESDFPSLGKMAIVERQTQNFVGYCGVERTLLEGQSIHEFGLMLHKNFWGKGYGSEAAAHVLACQRDRQQLDRVVAIVDSRHAASKRVLLKAGMQIVKQSSYGDLAVDILLI